MTGHCLCNLVSEPSYSFEHGLCLRNVVGACLQAPQSVLDSSGRGSRFCLGFSLLLNHQVMAPASRRNWGGGGGTHGFPSTLKDFIWQPVWALHSAPSQAYEFQKSLSRRLRPTPPLRLALSQPALFRTCSYILFAFASSSLQTNCQNYP